MTLDEMRELAPEILGLTMSESAVIEYFDLDITEEDLVSLLLDLSVELCPACGTWMETCEFDEDELVCLSCARGE